MKEPVWVVKQLVISAHKMLLSEYGGSSGLRDRALLDSAIARPQQRFSYEPESSIFELATSYSYGLAKNHAFVDGNKRIAFTVAAVFLEINGSHFNAPESEVVVIFENLASNNITENEITDWFKASSVSIAAGC
ncbi:MAG: type II toxin-antitoxin system death-on-curing family toxin [Gammaproteobacteria bacterium]|nr:type II toxin-antitoxin system death-on-curing family toxin [Gammaproteobacteria bacterium]